MNWDDVPSRKLSGRDTFHINQLRRPCRIRHGVPSRDFMLDIPVDSDPRNGVTSPSHSTNRTPY